MSHNRQKPSDREENKAIGDRQRDIREVTGEIVTQLEAELKKNATAKCQRKERDFIDLPVESLSGYLTSIIGRLNLSSSDLTRMMQILKKFPVEFNPLTAHRLIVTSLYVTKYNTPEKAEGFAATMRISRDELDKLKNQLYPKVEEKAAPALAIGRKPKVFTFSKRDRDISHMRREILINFANTGSPTQGGTFRLFSRAELAKKIKASAEEPAPSGNEEYKKS